MNLNKTTSINDVVHNAKKKLGLLFSVHWGLTENRTSNTAVIKALEDRSSSSPPVSQNRDRAAKGGSISNQSQNVFFYSSSSVTVPTVDNKKCGRSSKQKRSLDFCPII